MAAATHSFTGSVTVSLSPSATFSTITGFSGSVTISLGASNSISTSVGTSSTTSGTVTTIFLTNTIIGWNVPDAAHLSAGLIPFLFPILIAGLLSAIPSMLGIKGEVQSLLIRVGLFFGSILGMLSLGGSSSSAFNLVPFTFPVVTAIYLAMYLWKRV